MTSAAFGWLVLHVWIGLSWGVRGVWWAAAFGVAAVAFDLADYHRQLRLGRLEPCEPMEAT